MLPMLDLLIDTITSKAQKKNSKKNLADEEAMLIHQLEMLEIQEEIDNEDDDEDLIRIQF